MQRSLVGHRVVTARRQRVAAQNAAQTEPGAAQGAVPFDRRVRVAGTTRIEPAARPQQGAHDELVGANDHEEQLTHQTDQRLAIVCQWRARLARKSAALAFRAASRALTVTSTEGSPC